MRSLPDKFFDLAIADPPYGTADVKAHDPRGRYGARFNKYRDTSDTSPTAWDVAPPQEFFDELRRVSCHQIIWGGNFFAMPPAKCFLVWVKTNIPEKFTMAMCEYAWTSLTGNAKVFYHSAMRAFRPALPRHHARRSQRPAPPVAPVLSPTLSPVRDTTSPAVRNAGTVQGRASPSARATTLQHLPP